MKIGIFTDSHYSSQKITCGKRYNSKSLEKIKQAYAFFESEKCDLVICLGDLIDKEASHETEVANLKEVAKIIRKSALKTICLMGNHDAFAFTETEFYEILGDCKPKNVKAEGKTLLFLDACYFKNGKHYLPGDTDWTDTFYPHIEDLKKQIDETTDDVYVFVHQNMDPNIREDHCLHNSIEINGMLQESGKVKAVYQGHYHPGMESKHGNIEYFTFSAMCENVNAHYILNI